MEPYIPEPLPFDVNKLNWLRIAMKLSEASSELAYYNGVLHGLINPAIFLSPLEIKEAVLSSRIEGTITTVDEILKYEADLKPDTLEKQNDIIEVLNYRKATRHAKDWINRGFPFNLTFICAIQNELMQGVRGKDKQPGQIRNEQVWIGPKGCTIEEASYVPPEPTGLRAHLQNLIEFLNHPDQEVLIQTAIMHAQFEIIHPFFDGNGRTGRILIPLFLWHKQRISSPMFYISEYFDENRDLYVELLKRISNEKDWEQWILFFLDAISIQAKRNSEKAKQVLQLYDSMREYFSSISRSAHANKALDTLFITPLFKASDFITLSGLDSKTAHRILARLKTEKILSTIQKHAGRTPEVLLFEDLFRLVR